MLRRGQIFDKQAEAATPQCGPCQKLDIELEMVSPPLAWLGSACSQLLQFLHQCIAFVFRAP